MHGYTVPRVWPYRVVLMCWVIVESEHPAPEQSRHPLEAEVVAYTERVDKALQRVRTQARVQADVPGIRLG